MFTWRGYLEAVVLVEHTTHYGKLRVWKVFVSILLAG